MKTLFVAPVFLFCILLCKAQPNIELEAVSSGFNLPIDIKNAGDSRLFIVERAGRIIILNDDGSVNATPFLDIDADVIAPGGPGDEGGLLGLAFHPNYTNNGYFYVNYINNAGNTVIERFTVSSNPDIASISSRTTIMNVNQPFANHNGGHLAFGSDGYLYIGLGDGGSGGDPDNYGQNLNSPLGKMLRIDIDNGSPYSIPAGNPFATDGDPNTLAEIWGYGLRNPWRFSFDSLNGDLWVADVGQASFEEINQTSASEAGVNYGWRCYEANNAFDTAGCDPANTMTFPVGSYSHTGNGLFKCSISGGYVYRGSDFPDLQGVYFFADYCSNEVGTLEFNGSGWDINFNGPFGSQGFVTFGEDQNKELYIAGLESGQLFRVIDGNLGLNDVNRPGFKMYPNPVNELLNIEWPSGTTSAQVSIYDLLGKRVLQRKGDSETLGVVSTESLAKGIYLINLNSNQGSLNKKLIVE